MGAARAVPRDLGPRVLKCSPSSPGQAPRRVGEMLPPQLLNTRHTIYILKDEASKNRIQVMITIMLNEYLSSEIINAF